MTPHTFWRVTGLHWPDERDLPTVVLTVPEGHDPMKTLRVVSGMRPLHGVATPLAGPPTWIVDLETVLLVIHEQRIVASALAEDVTTDVLESLVSALSPGPVWRVEAGALHTALLDEHDAAYRLQHGLDAAPPYVMADVLFAGMLRTAPYRLAALPRLLVGAWPFDPERGRRRDQQTIDRVTEALNEELP